MFVPSPCSFRIWPVSPGSSTLEISPSALSSHASRARPPPPRPSVSPPSERDEKRIGRVKVFYTFFLLEESERGREGGQRKRRS